MPEKTEAMLGKGPNNPPPPAPPVPPAELDCSDEAIAKRLEEAQKAKQKILHEAQCIIKEFGGLSANIPVTSAYWGLMNEYRSMLPTPLPSSRITEPYRELSPESLHKPDRPGQIMRDMQEQLAHYDKQHPPAQAVLQLEIQKENEARMTGEEKAARDKVQKEAEKKLQDDTKKAEEADKRRVEEERRRLEERMKALDAERKQP